MKTIPIIYYAIICFLFTTSCEHYEEIDLCNARADFETLGDIDCVPPCDVTFTFTGEGDVDRLQWNFGDDQGFFPMANNSFVHTFEEAGVYQIQLLLETKDCLNRIDSKEIVIGVDQPVAKIEVNTNCCNLDSCGITFSYSPAANNTTEWFWKFPGDSREYNDSTFTYNFTERPDTFPVILTARNGNLEDRDTVMIFVEPVTFDINIELDTNSSAPFEKTICIQENSNGNYSLAVNNSFKTYLAEFTRNGAYVPGSKSDIRFPLDGNYPSQETFYCYKGSNSHLILGSAFYTLSNTLDVYVIGLTNDFKLENVPTPINYPVAGSDGQEIGLSATEIPGGGYLVCGHKNNKAPAGMYFLTLDASFEFDGSASSTFVYYDENQNNKATGITTISSGYAVVGKRFNPDSGQAEGGFFELDNSFGLKASTFKYLGGFIPDDIIAVAGGYVTFGKAGSTGIVRFLDLSGGTVWSKPYGNTDFKQAIITRDGQIAIAGFEQSGIINVPLLLKINLVTEAEEINKKFPLGGRSREIHSLAQTQDNGFILGGFENSNGNLLLIRTNKNGEPSK